MTLAKEIIRITTKTVLNSFKNEGIHPKSNPLHTLMYKTCLTSPRFTLYLLSAHIWWLANSTYCSLPHHQRPQTFAKCISHRNNLLAQHTLRQSVTAYTTKNTQLSLFDKHKLMHNMHTQHFSMLVNNRIQQPRQLVQCELFNNTERMASNKIPREKAQLQKKYFFIKVLWIFLFIIKTWRVI